MVGNSRELQNGTSQVRNANFGYWQYEFVFCFLGVVALLDAGVVLVAVMIFL